MRDALGSVQSVLLLGGTSEIGAAIVRALVADRARKVVLAARDVAATESLAGELRVAGAEVDAVAFDAARIDEHRAILGDVFARHGDLDVVLVAFGALGPSGDDQLRAAAGLQQVNGAGAVSAMALGAELLRGQGHGTIVLLSSIAADRPRVANYAYGASKAAADVFARGLADALHGTAVDVVTVRPGFVHTRMTRGMDPAPLSVGPEAVAEAVVRALRRRERVVYVPRALRWVSLVLRLLPAPVLRRLPR